MLVYQNHNNHQGKRIDWYQNHVNRELKQQGELRIVSLAAEILVNNFTILLVYLKFGLNIFYFLFINIWGKFLKFEQNRQARRLSYVFSFLYSTKGLENPSFLREKVTRCEVRVFSHYRGVL